MSGSPEGTALRQYADAQDALAETVSALGTRFGGLGPDSKQAISGFPFAGPFAEEVRSRVGDVARLFELAEGQLKQAAGRLRSRANEYRGRAANADAAYLAQQLLDDLFDGDS